MSSTIVVPSSAQIETYPPETARQLIAVATAAKADIDALGTGSVPTTRTITAGAGLTGGGDLSANRTINVVANGDGSIVVNADDIQVGILASDAQHGTRGGGTQHAVATSLANGFMSSTDKAKLDTVQGGTSTLVAGTVTIATANITANSRILIQMKDPGAGAITGFAGFEVPVASRVVGAPGSFTVNAIDDTKAPIATAVCTFDWFVFN